jgi:hypothetical protein
MIDKIELLSKELSYIKDPEIGRFTYESILSLPNYFFEVAASSSGKYHPNYALGEGGLLRHTIATVRIAVELFRIDGFNFSEEEKDLIIASLILHDGWKRGKDNDEHTQAEHPKLAVSTLIENIEISEILTKEQFHIILNNILTHMGQWNKDYKTGEEIMPKPKTKMQAFVHLCDYLASRKCLEMNFDAKVERN